MVGVLRKGVRVHGNGFCYDEMTCSSVEESDGLRVVETRLQPVVI